MPAILFNLWNPYRADDGTLTFEVTQADTFRMNQGTREFMDAALHALGITTGEYSWRILPARAFYYSDDPDRDDWRDRWPRTWRVHVVPDTPLAPRTNTLFRAPVDQGLSDNTWPGSDDDDDERYRHTAFVIADLRKPIDEIEQIVQTALAATALRATPLSPAIRELAGDIRQVQMLVENVELPADVGALDALVAGLKTAGGAVNWRSRLTWATEPRREQPPDIAAWLSSFEQLRKKE